MLDKFRAGAKSFGVMLIFGIIIIVFVFWGVGNFNAPSSRTLAEVNGSPITIQEFGRAFTNEMNARQKEEPNILGNAEAIKQIKRAVLEDLVRMRALILAADKIGIIVTPQDVRKAIDTIPAFQNAEGKFDKDIFQRTLAENNIAQDTFLDEVADEITQKRLLLYVQQSAGINEAEEKVNYQFALEKRKAQYVLFKPSDYLDKVSISEDEMQKEYENTKESFRNPQQVSLEYIRLTPESLTGLYPVSDAEAQAYFESNKNSFHKPERVLLRHVFVSFPVAGQHARPLSKEEQEAAAKEIMDKALADLAAGKDFAEVASLYSHDQQSAIQGGMLDWITRGDIPIKEFEDAAFALKKGERSGVVASTQGLHLLEVVDREDERQPDFAANKEAVVKAVGMQKANDDFASVLQRAEDGLSLGTPFAELGEKLKLPVQKTGLVPLTDAEKALALKDDSRTPLNEAIALTLGSAKPRETQGNSTTATHPRKQTPRTIPVPLNIENGVSLVHVSEVTESYIRPFSEVKESLRDRMKAERSIVMARQEAEKALPTFKGKEVPEAYQNSVEISKEGARAFPILEPFGTAPQLIQGIFSSKGEWLPLVYETNLGPVIARCANVEKVSDAEWDRWKGIFMAQRIEFRRNQVLQAFMDGLDEQLTFTVNTELLDSLSTDRR